MIGSHTGVRVAAHPYPYVASLALSSDLDGTATADDYFVLIRALNPSRAADRSGHVPAHFANSLFFHEPGGKFCYDTTTPAERVIVRALVESGHIDTLHSMGSGVTDASALKACIEEMGRHGLRFPVWINHSTALTNIWSPRRPDVIGGDDPASAVYHAGSWSDLGIVYFGRGQTTSVIGQETWPNPVRLVTRGSYREIRAAGVSAAKLASFAFSPKWRRHIGNALGRQASLRDGQQRIEILRGNWCAAGIREGARPGAIAEMLSMPKLRRLAAAGGSAVLYTHLGTIPSLRAGEREGLLAVLDGFLATAAELGILVRSTSAIMDFVELRRALRVSRRTSEGQSRVELDLVSPPYLRERLRAHLPGSGLTLRAKSVGRPELVLVGELADLTSITVSYEEESPGLWRMQFPLRVPALPPALA